MSSPSRSKYSNSAEAEVQAYLDQVRKGQAGQDPQAQTLARSTSNPQAQRQGMRAMADRTSDNLANIEDAQREQERAAKQAERATVKAAKEQDRAAEASRARDVRAAAAAGAKTVTDIETGKRSIATHPDGAPVFESGPISPVKPLSEVGQTLQDSQTGEKRDVPNMGIMLGGDSGALGATGTERQQVLGQQVRDDRGNVSVIPPKTETDPKTGMVTYDQKNDTTGRTEKLPAGIDWQAREIAARKAQNAQDEQAAALEFNAAAQARAAFEPQWQPVKAEYLKAKSELETLPSPLVRRGSAWVHIDERTGKETMATPAEVEYQKKRREEAQARYDRAAAAHDPLAAQNEQITLAERSAKEKRLKVAEDRIRIEAGLPDEATETLTRTLAAQQAPDVTAPETEAAREVIGTPEPSANPAAPAPEKPLIPTDDPIRTKNFAAAFEGLRDPGQFTVGMTGDGYKMIQRNGANVGMIEDSGGAPVVVLNNGANQDLKNIASLGGTKGVPVYLTDGGKRQPIAKEAAWATQAFQTANQAMALPFGFNDMLQTPGTASPLADITGQLKDMGADYQSIVAKVKNGDISMQIGESLVKGIYGETLQATDPLKPEAFTSFLDENPDQKTAWQAAANDKPAQSAIVSGFVSDWYAKNQHKPGVTWAMQEAARQALAPGSGGAWQKTKDVGGFLLDAGGSMIGLLAAYPTLTGMGIYSGLSSDEAVDTANKELWEQRLRADKNFVRGLETNFKKWTTPEGKKATATLQSALMDLRAANTTRDVYPEGVTDPRWKADVKAKIEAVTDATFALHSLNLENGWAISRDDVDPNKNKVLKASLGAYLETGDSDAWQQFQRRLLLDKGSLQSEQYNKDLTAGSGRFASAVIGGAVASDFEAVVEILSDVATFGAAKAITLGGKALKAESVAAKFAGASRIARFGEQAAKEFHNLGMVADTLANPASKLGKASNFLVKGSKAGAVNAATEGVEEGISALGDPTTTFASGMEQAAGGALMGLVLAPIMVVPSMAATMSRENYKSEQRVKSLVEAYNKAGAKDPDFKPITRDQAIAAIQLADNPARKVASDKLEAAKIELELANNELAGTQAGLKNIQAQGKDAAVAVPGDQRADTTSRAEALQRWQADNASQEQSAQGRVESAASRYSRALGAYAEAAGEMTNIMGTALEVSQSTQGMSAADRAQVVGLAKVGFGRADLLTGSERSAIAGRKTREGLPYFETTKDGSEILTDAGRAEVQEQFPILGRHLATPESSALFNAAKATQPQPTATNGQDVQGQPGPQAAPQAAQPAPANPVAPGGSVQPAAGPAWNAGGTGAATPEAVASYAASDAAIYTAARQANPALPSISDVVTAAKAAGHPVSPSMEQAAAQEAQSQPAQPQAQSAPSEQPAASPPKPRKALGIAERIKSRVEAAIPGLKGRVNVIEKAQRRSGGVIANADGTVSLVLSDIEAQLGKFDAQAVEDSISAMVSEHEVTHVVQYQAVRKAWEDAGGEGDFTTFWNEWYGKIAGEISPEVFAEARKIYGAADWDAIPTPANKAAELVRMLVEASRPGADKGRFSELMRALSLKQSPTLIETIRRAVEILVDMVKTGKLPVAVREHVEAISALYDQLLAAEPAIPEISDDLADSRAVAMQAVRDAKENLPILKANDDLRIDLETVAWDLAEVMAGMPAEERQAFVDTTIREWLESNAASIEQVTEEAAAAKDAGKPASAREKAKAAREAYQARIRAKAREILNSGDFSVLSAIFDKGAITPKPNAIALILKRKKDGKKLTEKEMNILRPHKEGGHWDGMPRKQDYPGRGNNAIVRAIIDSIMAPQGKGQMPHEMATAINQKDIGKASEMWEAIYRELESISRGKPMDMGDPDAIETPENIAKAEAERAAMPDTMGNVVDEARAEFGDDHPVTRKAMLFTDYADRLTPEMEDMLIQTMQAEAGRIRAGVVSPTAWQEMTQGWTDQFKAVHKAIASHTPESLEAWLKGLPVIEEEAPMFSSDPNPDFQKLRNDITSTLTKSPNQHRYEPTTERRPGISKFLRDNQLFPVAPTDAPIAADDIERVSGAQIIFVRKRVPGGFASTNSLSVPRLIAIDSQADAQSVGYMIAHEMVHVAQKSSNAPSGPILQTISRLVPQQELQALKAHLLRTGYQDIPQVIAAEIHAHLVADAVAGTNMIGLEFLTNREELTKSLVDYFDSLPRLEPDAQPGQYFAEARLYSSQPGFDFGAPLDASTKDQAGFNFDIPAGPLAKFQENAQKAMDSAKTDKAKENIAARVAEKEGITDAKPYIKAAIGGQAAFNFGTEASFGTKGGQMGFDFAGKPVVANEKPVRETQSPLSLTGESQAAGPMDAQEIRRLMSAIDSAVFQDGVNPSIQRDGQRLIDAAKKIDIQTLEQLSKKYARAAGTRYGGSGAGPGKVWTPPRGAAIIGDNADLILSRYRKIDPKPSPQETAKAAKPPQASPAIVAEYLDTLQSLPEGADQLRAQGMILKEPYESKALRLEELELQYPDITEQASDLQSERVKQRRAAKTAKSTQEAPTIDAAAQEAATSPTNSTPEPTEAQKKAGNYKVGRVTIGGMEISIENPAGSIRSGTDKDGEKWEVEMQSHYGYIRATKGKDGDHIDIFIQEGTPLDYTGPVFVVNQNKEDGSFDEHKAVMGPDIATEDQAKAEYLSNYSPGWKGAGDIARFESVDAFREWATEKRRIAPAKGESTPVETTPTQAETEAITIQPNFLPQIREGITRAKIESELKAGERSGNFSLVTDARFRLAVLTGDPKNIYDTMLAEMGIKAPVTRMGNDLFIEVTTNPSMATLMRSLRGSFKVLAAMTEDGRQAIKILGVSQNQTPAPGTPDFRLLPPAEKKEIVKAKTEAKAAEKGIQDFGEKIGGARKDLWGSFNHAIKEQLPADPADIALSKNLPEPDYQMAIDNGIPVESLATFKAIRDLIPSKPRVPYKLKQWAEIVRILHPMMQRLATGGQLTEAENQALVKALWRDGGIAKKITLYRELGFPAFTKASDWNVLPNVSFFYRNGKKLDAAIPGTAAIYKGRMHPTIESYQAGPEGIAEVTDKIRATILKEMSGPDSGKAKPIPFSIYQDRLTRDVFIGKKATNGVIRLKTGFATPKEAREYLADNQSALEEQWKGLKAEPDYRRPVNAPRQGPIRRPGDVTPEQFQEAFGFRGVQFGNWVEDSRRQTDLNEAFDALMDLADALGIPAKAVSLDGSLGLAFGARGHAGAAAHYEPDKVVINLTKKAGPGSLGHEWFHAFDNYFARLDDTGETTAKALDRFSTQYSGRPKNMRPEVWEAFKGIRLALDSGPFAERSKKLDDFKSKPYYATIIEKAARAFEKYTVDRLEGREISNDYLVNIVKGDDPALPTKKEMDAGIRQAYDNLFNVLDTRETGKGVQLYSSAPQQPDLFAAATAPDAADNLGDVKVGRMNALAAYRALTAKRNGGKALDAKEEQQLLDAEQALGQKLAFDMEAVKNPETSADPGPEETVIVIKTKPEKSDRGPVMDFADAVQKEKGTFRTNQLYRFGDVIVRFFDGSNKWMGMDFYRPANLKGTPNAYTVTRVSSTGKRSEEGFITLNLPTIKESLTTPPPVFGQNRRDIQDEMMRTGEVDRSGQISLLSSAVANHELTSSLSKPPSSYEYAEGNPSNQTARNILEQLRLPARIPSNPNREISEIQSRTGVEIVFYESEDIQQGGFTVGLAPSVVFINTKYSDAPISSVIAHEITHVAQKDSRSDTRSLYRQIMGMLTDQEKAEISDTIYEIGYEEEHMGIEIPAFLMGDVISGGNLTGIDGFEKSDEIKALMTGFYNGIKDLQPDAQPGSLESNPMRSAVHWPRNLYAYDYRTEGRGGDVQHIVRAYNERTGLKEDRKFDTYAEAKAEMDRLDDLGSPALFSSIPNMPAPPPRTAFERTAKRLDALGRTKRTVRQEDAFDAFFAEELAKDEEYDKKLSEWVNAIPENKPISFIRDTGDGLPFYYTVTKNTTDPARPWRTTYFHTLRRPDWTDEEEIEYETLFKKTRWYSNSPEWQKWNDRLYELGSRETTTNNTRIVPSGHDESKTRMEAVKHAVSMAGNREPKIGSLFSSAPENDPFQLALSKMPPIYGEVFRAVEAGMSPEDVAAKFNIPSKAVTNILNDVRSRAVIAAKAQAGTLKPETNADGKFVNGRPDLAEGANPDFVAIDQNRNESGIPDVVSMEENYAEADRRLAANYEGEFARLERMAAGGQRPDRIDIALAKQIFRRETLSGGLADPQRRARVALFRVAYREQGTEQGRAFQMRRDEALTPAERNALYFTELLYEPPPQVQERMKGADPETRDAILKKWMDQIDAFKAEMKADGIDIEASLAAWHAHKAAVEKAEQVHAGTKTAMDEAFMKLSPPEKMVIRLIRDKAKLSTVMRQTGMTQEQVMDVKNRFGMAWKQAIIDAGKKFAANSLASSAPEDIYDMVMSDLGWQSDEDFNDLAPDYFEKQDQKRKDAKARERKRKELAAPKVPTLTPKQQEALDAAWERFQAAPPSTWNTLFQTEEKNLAPLVGQTAFQQWKGEILKPWRELWQTEMDAITDPAGRITFEQWIAKPRTAWTAKQTELFEKERLPINETRGTFDVNDPIVMAEIVNEWARRNGSWINKLTEFYKMAILSGPQTMLVNASGGLYVGYDLTVKRATEAAWNGLMGMFGAGDVRSATFSEFLPMLKQVRAAASLAARNALESWKLQSPVFDSYASAKPIQLDFTGVGPEYAPPATTSAISRFLRNITFRELTAVDEFWKGMFAQMDVAALAHRIAAKEEGLSGKDYTDRVEQLMKRGSLAWQRSISRTKRATFQDEIAYGKWTAEDEKKNPAHKEGMPMTWRQALKKSETESAWTILDAIAAKAMEARKTPFFGPLLHVFALPFIATPKNMIQRGLEVTPLGLVIDLIDGMRSLRRRVMSGQITKEESNRIASELYNNTRFIQLLTNQTMGVMIYLAVESLTGGDDDDEYGRPVITGTLPYTGTKKGERDNADAVMPPQSIRIGDTIIPYGRIEPLATALGVIADMAKSIDRNDGFNSKVVGDFYDGLLNQGENKLFLKGIGDIIGAVRHPERATDRLAAGWITGFIPNILRQPIRETDKTLRDTNPQADDGFFTAVGKRIGYSVAPQFAPAKLDVWGNDIPSNRGELIGGSTLADSVFRIFDPFNVRIGGKIRPIDAWIFRYNSSQPDSSQRIGIEPIGDEVTITVPGETKPRKIALTAQEHAEAIRRIGQAAQSFLGDDWDWKTANAPDAAQRADLIKDTFTTLKRQETERLKIEKAAAATK